MSATRKKEVEKNSANDKKFKQVTASIVNGGNYAFSATGVVGLILSVIGVTVGIPPLAMLLVPAAIGLIFYAIGVYVKASSPDQEEIVKGKLEDIESEIKEVIDGQKDLRKNYKLDKKLQDSPSQKSEQKEVKETKEVKSSHPSELSIFAHQVQWHSNTIPMPPARMTMDESLEPVKLHKQKVLGG